MYLKEVILENFKSFGNKKRIPFLKGFTVITGPNGSGKSNIGDAILFVLGPKSPKAIRAGKLTNLIYNGGKSKKPAKHCRVSLVFDNTDRIIPLEQDEVTLTRLVKLSPSDPENYLSYFYVNGRKSSLSEFDELLSHAHISADGYNLVKQGDVTRIVEMSNVERRKVLDDISGVTTYDEDIKAAEEKRKGVEENLDRIGIIIEEIKRQIKLLEKERGQALKYKELKDNYDLAKAQMAYKKKEMIEAEIVSIVNQIEKYNQKEEIFHNQIAEHKKELEQLEKDLKEMEEKIACEGGEEAKQLKLKIDELRIEIARSKDKIVSSKDTLKTLKGEYKIFNDDLSKLNEVLENLKDEKKKTDLELNGKKEEFKTKKDEYEKTQKMVGESDSEALEIQKSIFDVNKNIESKEDDLRKIKIEQDRFTEKANRLRENIAELEEEKRTFEFEIKDADFELSDLTKNAKQQEKSLQSLKDDLDKKTEEEKKHAKESQELEAAITTLTREYNRLKAEAEAAESIKMGYNLAVSFILEARDKGILKGICGTVAELAKVEDKFEAALGVAAGSRMQSIVVDDDECAAKAIEYLKKKKKGRATFLPLNKMSEGRPRGKALMACRNSKSLGFAIDLIDFKPEYRAAFWYVLGDTLVVEDLKTARELMGGIRLVTLEGELIEAAGAMIGGMLDTKQLKFGAPSQSDIEKIGKELRTAIEHADSLSKTLSDIKNDIILLETQIRNYDGNNGTSTLKIEDLKSKKKEYKKKLAGIVENLENKSRELEESENILNELNENLQVITVEIENLMENREGFRKALIKATPQEYAKQIKNLQNAVHNLTNEIAQADSTSKTLETQIKMHMERETEIKNNLKGIEKEQKGQENTIKESTKKQKEFENELAALLKVEASLNQEMKSLSKKRDEIFKKKSDCEIQIDKVLTKIETNRDFVIGLNNKANSMKDSLLEVESEIKEYDIQIAQEKNLPSIEELKDTIAGCERRMRNLEPINMKAIDDYEEQEKRLSELIDEVKHLKDQKRNLLAVVKELDNKKKVEFMEVFDGINKNFKVIFSKLSVDGEAELLLENPESPFEAGLVIKARPRGKKILRLESLSGGEKSLTALALIFAVQHYKPSPFYLLDEVDMFLDAINTEHVARMIKENSRSAQFVMVSLRKVTLKEADAIYGVTMRADSISDVVGNVAISDFGEDIPPLAPDDESLKDESEEIQELIEVAEKNQEGESHA